jgi:hypothetical protein
MDKKIETKSLVDIKSTAPLTINNNINVNWILLTNSKYSFVDYNCNNNKNTIITSKYSYINTNKLITDHIESVNILSFIHRIFNCFY